MFFREYQSSIKIQTRKEFAMLFILAMLATIGGILFVSLPEVVKQDILFKIVEALSKGAHSASDIVSKTGEGIVKFLLRGTIVGTVAVVGFSVLDMVADQRLQLPTSQVQILKDYWHLIDKAAQESDTDPYMIAAIWRVENSLLPTGPSNQQGIGGFYSAVQAGERFPVGQLSDGEILSQLTRIGNILHGKCPGVDISYTSQNNYSEDHMWARALCFATYNGSQRTLVRGVYQSNGQVFNNLPGRPETNGLIICLTDGCTKVGPMQHDGYETSYRKIKAHVVSNPQMKGGVTDPIQAIVRITDKVSGELERMAMALDAITIAWKAQNIVEEAYVSVIKPVQEDKLAWPGPSNTWIQFAFGSPPRYSWSSFHNGVDIDAPGFRPFTVTSASTGRVIYAQYMDACNMGVVKVQWTRSKQVVYVHLDPDNLRVGRGDEVVPGQVIGTVYDGKTTCSDGPHLHFMLVENGVPINPQPYLVKE